MSLSSTGRRICALSRDELAHRFSEGHIVIPDSIVGYRYRGVSLGLPEWVERLSWKKFAKTFYRHSSGKIRGVNLRMEQDGLDKDWTVKRRRGSEWSFGPYELTQADGSEHLEIHYGKGSKGLSPLRRLRDPLRRLDDAGDLLLGASLVDLGFGKRLATPSWFLLERDRPL